MWLMLAGASISCNWQWSFVGAANRVSYDTPTMKSSAVIFLKCSIPTWKVMSTLEGKVFNCFSAGKWRPVMGTFTVFSVRMSA